MVVLGCLSWKYSVCLYQPLFQCLTAPSTSKSAIIARVDDSKEIIYETSNASSFPRTKYGRFEYSINHKSITSFFTMNIPNLQQLHLYLDSPTKSHLMGSWPPRCQQPAQHPTRTLAFRTLSTVEPIWAASMKPLFAVELTPRMPSWNMELTCGLNFLPANQEGQCHGGQTHIMYPHPIAL